MKKYNQYDIVTSIRKVIKLRGWNIVTKKLIYGVEFDREYCTNPDNIITQFTGLKDKNGNDIYEGDIIKSPYVKKPFLVTWDDNYCCFGWEFYTKTKKEGGLLCKALQDAPDLTKNEFSNIIEVIGNVFDDYNIFDTL